MAKRFYSVDINNTPNDFVTVKTIECNSYWEAYRVAKKESLTCVSADLVAEEMQITGLSMGEYVPVQVYSQRFENGKAFDKFYLED